MPDYRSNRRVRPHRGVSARWKSARRPQPDGRVLVVAQGPRADCEWLLELLQGGTTPGSVDKVVADFTEPGEPFSGFHER